MSSTNYPANYLAKNAQRSKALNVVVQIAGVPQTFSLVPIYQKIRYGDPRLVYGLPGLTYGGLELLEDQMSILKIDSGLNITQAIEPEQGRGSVATISLQFIDKAGYMSRVIAPGVIIPDILGNTLVTVSVGYANTAFPGDYYKVFRGYVSKTQSSPGLVTLELSDANIKRRQTIFLGGTDALPLPLDAATTIIPMANPAAFIQQIRGPSGGYDSGVTTYLLIDSEYMIYAPNSLVGTLPVSTQATWVTGTSTLTVTSAAGLINGLAVGAALAGIPANTIITGIVGTTVTINTVTTTTQAGATDVAFYPVLNVVGRGGAYSRGTASAAHDPGAAITNVVQFQDNAIAMALKIMMSGWGGAWLSGVPCTALGTSLDPSNPQTNVIVLPPGVDAQDDYGLTVGDYITVSDSMAGNNGTYTITDIQDDLGDSNRMIFVNAPLTLENPASSVELAFRSQYDVYPLSCGLGNVPQEIDVAGHQEAQQFFFSAGFYQQQVVILDTQNGQGGKDLIEGTLWLPLGIYTITRYGRVSVAVTKPPIAGSSLVYLDGTNVIDPQTIMVERALNTRRFYNVVTYSYDLDDAGNYNSQDFLFDTNSLTKIDVEAVLPINADGTKSSLGGNVLVQTRGTFILNRYKNAAYQITLKCNWAAASLIEVGDVVALADNGDLKITNLEDGVRNLGTQLFEVIQRQLTIQKGQATLTLLSNLGYTVNQRFATISPSSIVSTGSNTVSVRIQNSFGNTNEPSKWKRFSGQNIVVHDPLWTRVATVQFLGFDAVDQYKMLLGSALPFTPQPGDLVDIVPYGASASPAVNKAYKTLYSFIDPSAAVVAGISGTQFTVSAGDAANVQVGAPLFIHDVGYNTISKPCAVLSVVGTTVTLKTSLGFTPTAGMIAENLGWPDGGGSYLIL
jgi:hypothetical protein